MATDYGLICPFLTSDPMFAYGVEFGMLYARMRDGGEDVVEDYFCRANEDQITLLANRTGWHVAEMKPWDEECWTWFRLERKSPVERSAGDFPAATDW